MCKYIEWEQKEKLETVSEVLTSECLFLSGWDSSAYFLYYYILILDFLLQYNKFFIKKQQLYFCFVPLFWSLQDMGCCCCLLLRKEDNR